MFVMQIIYMSVLDFCMSTPRLLYFTQWHLSLHFNCSSKLVFNSNFCKKTTKKVNTTVYKKDYIEKILMFFFVLKIGIKYLRIIWGAENANSIRAFSSWQKLNELSDFYSLREYICYSLSRVHIQKANFTIKFKIKKKMFKKIACICFHPWPNKEKITDKQSTCSWIQLPSPVKRKRQSKSFHF